MIPASEVRAGDRLTADGSRIEVGHVRRPRPPRPTWVSIVPARIEELPARLLGRRHA